MPTASWYFLDALDMSAPAGTQAIVAFGDSITDGTASTINGDDRWPDAFARRLHAEVQERRPERLHLLGDLGAHVVAGRWCDAERLIPRRRERRRRAEAVGRRHVQQRRRIAGLEPLLAQCFEPLQGLAGTLIVEDPGWMKLFADYQLLLNHVAGGVVGVAIVRRGLRADRRRRGAQEGRGR